MQWQKWKRKCERRQRRWHHPLHPQHCLFKNHFLRELFRLHLRVYMRRLRQREEVLLPLHRLERLQQHLDHLHHLLHLNLLQPRRHRYDDKCRHPLSRFLLPLLVHRYLLKSLLKRKINQENLHVCLSAHLNLLPHNPQARDKYSMYRQPSKEQVLESTIQRHQAHLHCLAE